MKKLLGNCVVAQSGGPTAVINSSICGVIQQAQKSKTILKIYGANNGILGILYEDLFDIGKEKKQTIIFIESEDFSKVKIESKE